jgi:hypothetical protein
MLAARKAVVIPAAPRQLCASASNLCFGRGRFDDDDIDNFCGSVLTSADASSSSSSS